MTLHPRQPSPAQVRQSRVVALLLLAMLLTGSFFLWKHSVIFLTGRLNDASEEKSQLAIERLGAFFEERLVTLRRISQFCTYAELAPVNAYEGVDPQRRAFEGFCRAIMVDVPGILAVIRTDIDGLPSWITPADRLPASVANFISADPKFTRTLQRSLAQGDSAVSEPMILAGHGDGFVAACPIMIGYRHQGYIVGVFPYRSLVEDLLQPDILQQYHVRITHGVRLVHPLLGQDPAAWTNSAEDLPAEGQVRKALFIGDQVWQIEVAPVFASQASPSNFLSLTILGLGLALSVMLSWLLYRARLRGAQLRLEASDNRERLQDAGMDLVEVRSQLEMLLNSVEEGIVIYDGQATPLLANTAFLGMFGFAGADLRQGTSHHEHLVRRFGSESKYWSVFDALRRHPEQHYADELTAPDLRKPLDGRAYVRRAMTVTTPEGERRGLIVIYKDVTRAKAADRVKDEFLSGVTHELRSPLASIKGFAEMLRRDPELPPERRSEFTGIICEETARLQQLVDELLDLRRMEAGGVPINPVLCDLRRLIEEVVAGARAILLSRNLSVRVEWTGIEDARLQGDPGQLRRALNNLLVNSAKYSPPRGEIVILGRGGRDRIAIEIRDQGPGIADRDLPHIFDRFYRGARQGHQKGTGLGLAIVKHIIERHGGHIGVRSEIGEGSAFRFELPRSIPDGMLAPATDASGPSPAPVPAAAPGAR